MDATTNQETWAAEAVRAMLERIARAIGAEAELMVRRQQ